MSLASEERPFVAEYLEQDWQRIQAAMAHAEPVSSYRRRIQWYAVAACFLK